MLNFILICYSDDLAQWYSNLAHDIHFPAEFSSNPDQIHLPVISNDPEDID